MVVDPVRTRTAAASDEHLPIRPGTDALWLASLAHLVNPHTRLAAAEPWIDSAQWDQVTSGLAAFSPEATAVFTGIDAAVTRRIAELLDSRAAVYGRMGTLPGLTNTCGHANGHPRPWLIDIINIAIGSLIDPGRHVPSTSCRRSLHEDTRHRARRDPWSTAHSGALFPALRRVPRVRASRGDRHGSRHG